MKRLFSLALIVLFTLSMSAQVFQTKHNQNGNANNQTRQYELSGEPTHYTDYKVTATRGILFEDDLESGNLNNFTVINGGDANTFVNYASGGHNAPRCVRIAYSSTAHDDYLVLPQISVQPATIFSFWYKHQSNSFPEVFDVVLSTTGNTANDFTEVLVANVTPTTTYQEFTYDLSAYAGQQVYVAIHSTTTDQYFLFLDEFKVEKLPGATYTFDVTDGTNPVQGATVTVGSTDYTTDANGQVVTYFAPGDYNYVVSKLNYTGATGTYTVVDGVDSTIDVVITENLTYDVTFTVTNANTTPLENAMVTIYLNSTEVGGGLTDANGQYVIALADGNYTYDVDYMGYTSAIDSPFTVNGADLPVAVELEEIILPVLDLTYQLNGRNVTLNWNSPTYFSGSKQWDDGVNSDGIGTGSAFTFAVAHGYDVNDLVGMDGGNITKVYFFPNEASATYTIKVWQGADLTSMTEVYSQQVASITNAAWNEVTLTTPYTIDGNQMLLVGYEIVTTTGYPAGCDASLEHPGKGNLIYSGGAWAQLTDLAPSLTYDWNIKFDYQGDGYFAGQYNVYLNTVQNNIDPIDAKTYTINDLPVGDNTIGVTALYATDESTPEEVLITIVAINESDIKAFISPNPTKGMLNIVADGIYNINVVDVTGKIVASQSMNSTSTTIDINNLANGVYFIRLNNEQASKVVKVVKQ